MQDNATKKRILETAKEQFLKYGISIVRMEDLATEMGMSKKTIYNYYKSKEELVEESIMFIGGEARCWVDEIFEDNDMDFISKLKHFIRVVGKINTQMSPTVLEDLRRNAHSTWKLIENIRKKHITEGFKKILEDGITEGVFRANFNIDLVVLMYYHAINATINPEALSQAKYSPDEAFQTIFHVILQGIMTDEARIAMENEG